MRRSFGVSPLLCQPRCGKGSVHSHWVIGKAGTGAQCAGSMNVVCLFVFSLHLVVFVDPHCWTLTVPQTQYETCLLPIDKSSNEGTLVPDITHPMCPNTLLRFDILDRIIDHSISWFKVKNLVFPMFKRHKMMVNSAILIQIQIPHFG